MKVIVARCATVEQGDLQALFERLHEFLQAHDMQVQQLDLPPLEQDCGRLRQLVSYRLLSLAGAADALLCLDAYAAVLRHPRKCVWLLGGSVDIAGSSGGTSFTPNVLRASVHEASELFAPSAVAQQLRATGWKYVKELDPAALQNKRRSLTRSSGRRADSWAPLLQALRP